MQITLYYVKFLCMRLSSQLHKHHGKHTRPKLFNSWVSNPRPTQLYCVARGHICKFCISCGMSQQYLRQLGIPLTVFIFCWPCISLWFLVNDQLDAQFFSMYLFQISTCFEQPRAHHQEKQLCQYNLWYMSLCLGDRVVCRSEGNSL